MADRRREPSPARPSSRIGEEGKDGVGTQNVGHSDERSVAVTREWVRTHRLAIYIPAYNGARKIAQVFDRIPPFLWEAAAEVYVVDDGSTDGTREAVLEYKQRHGRDNLTVIRREQNRGYGASQKLAYRHAIDRDYDVVAMLHCDAQYAPEDMPRLLAHLIESNAGMVFGSRFTGDPLAGNMPLIRYVGVHFLNWVQNAVLRWNLSEYTSGYRIFRTEALRQVPFERCGDYYHFDTEILVQFRLKGIPVAEDTISTHYGDEENYVNIYKNGLLILGVMGEYLLHRLRLRRSPKFEV
jgi:glycosyltransferase involved in cell wall biosynthesis